MSDALRRAAQIVGLQAASELDTMGLIRHYEFRAPTPTHWLVRARIDPNHNYTWPRYELNRELSNLIRPWVNLGQGHFRPYGPSQRTSTEILATTEKKALRLQREGTKAGLIMEIIPSVLVPVRFMG